MFWDASLIEVMYTIEGRVDMRESDYTLHWSIGRFISFIIRGLVDSKVKRPSDLMKFPWEHEDIDKKTAEWVKKRWEKFRDRFEKLKSIPWGEGKKIDFDNREEMKSFRPPKPNTKA